MASKSAARIATDYIDEISVAIMDNMPIAKRFKPKDCLACVKREVEFTHMISDKLLQEAICMVLNNFGDITRIGNMYIWEHNRSN